VLRNGDLVLIRNHELVWWQRYPSHVGVVWIHKEYGPCVVELMPRCGGTVRLRAEEAFICRERIGDVRITPLAYYMDAREARTCIRQRQGPH